MSGDHPVRGNTPSWAHSVRGNICSFVCLLRGNRRSEGPSPRREPSSRRTTHCAGPPLNIQQRSRGGAVPSQKLIPRTRCSLAKDGPSATCSGVGHSGDSTHRCDTRFTHIHAPALPSCSQITWCIDVNKVDVDKALCVRVNIHCMRAPCPRVSITRACPASTCSAHTCAQVLLAHSCHAFFVYIDLSPWLLAYSLLDGCAQAPLNVWVHTYHCSVIYSKL